MNASWLIAEFRMTCYRLVASGPAGWHVQNVVDVPQWISICTEAAIYATGTKDSIKILPRSSG
jgi:hypothetical protein